MARNKESARSKQRENKGVALGCLAKGGYKGRTAERGMERRSGNRELAHAQHP